MLSRTTKSRFYLLVFLIQWASPDARAASYPYTDEEFSKLPPYCYAKLKGSPTEQKLWESRLGPNCFIHIHHYCAALNDVNHAMMAKTKKERDAALEYSMAGGFDYMWNQAGATCMMMPEIFVNKGKALAMLGKGNEAAAAFQKAMQLNQRYVPAYTALADLYKQTGQTDAARQLLDYALKIDPKSKSVQRRLAELDARNKSGKSANARGDASK
jgi:tetratricopeptide (TPR) repeat protein